MIILQEKLLMAMTCSIRSSKPYNSSRTTKKCKTKNHEDEQVI
ncbi:hypothetical protein [Vallitalea pronyensis]|nr:hypothetical protein [Vallitalea pronyensis]